MVFQTLNTETMRFTFRRDFDWCCVFLEQMFWNMVTVLLKSVMSTWDGACACKKVCLFYSKLYHGLIYCNMNLASCEILWDYCLMHDRRPNTVLNPNTACVFTACEKFCNKWISKCTPAVFSLLRLKGKYSLFQLFGTITTLWSGWVTLRIECMPLAKMNLQS